VGSRGLRRLGWVPHEAGLFCSLRVGFKGVNGGSAIACMHIYGRCLPTTSIPPLLLQRLGARCACASWLKYCFQLPLLNPNARHAASTRLMLTVPLMQARW
jgi:hypothetical protein